MRRTAAQWALLCLLLLGVVGMHHVNVGADMPGGHTAMSTPADAHVDHAPNEPAPAPAHDMLHLCVAILCAVASLLLLGLSLLRAARLSERRVTATPAWPRAPRKPPPKNGRALLNSLCVLRL